MHRHDELVAVLEVQGDVDVSRISGLRRTVDDLVVEGRVRLVIDLSGVGFIDSSGLGLLVGAHRKTRFFHGALAVVADGAVRRLMDVTGIDRFLGCHAEIGSALAAVTPAAGRHPRR